MLDHVKPSLIDLELPAGTTGGKQAFELCSLNEQAKGTLWGMRCSELRYNAKR
jgi:hypothetical protein